MHKNPLGQSVPLPDKYDPSLLFPIERTLNRQQISLSAADFSGSDVWNCYELNWLSPTGLPVARRMRMVYPSSSKFIVESKSLKLYLGSFNMTIFENEGQVVFTIKRDLTGILGGGQVEIILYDHQQVQTQITLDDDILLERKDSSLDTWSYDKNLIKVEEMDKQEIINATHLFRSNCPVTGQPDWATVVIRYRGGLRLVEQSLLAYLVSFRTHSDFHEACCERILDDLVAAADPEYLVAKCYFTRRGGIDINPCRYYGLPVESEPDILYFRQ